jgi:hypothetical chaperone protein
MGLSIGLDIGTSNSSAAVYDGEQVRLVPLDPQAPDPTVMRTLLYLGREGDCLVGQAALERYLERNVGHTVRLEPRYTGTIEMTLTSLEEKDPYNVVQDTYALVDVNEPGRLFQSIKTRLADRGSLSTDVYGRQYTLEELIALIARVIVERVEAFSGAPVQRLSVGRPVHFSVDPERDRAARERQEAAFARLGLPEVGFLEEPVAAAYDYARAAPNGQVALVFDFGGGTLDVSVIRIGDGTPAILTTGGVAIGGDLLDRRIVETHLLRHFGEDAHVGPQRLPLPRQLFGRLLSWQSMVQLNSREMFEVIHRGIAEGDRPRELRALLSLVSRNYGLELFRAVEGAKRQLSDCPSTVIDFVREQIEIREPISRGEFESAIRRQLLDVERCVLETVARSGTGPEQLEAIVTTGGSSRIPAFRAMLRRNFPRATLTERDAFTSVAAGLALAGASARTPAA